MERSLACLILRVAGLYILLTDAAFRVAGLSALPPLPDGEPLTFDFVCGTLATILVIYTPAAFIWWKLTPLLARGVAADAEPSRPGRPTA